MNSMQELWAHILENMFEKKPFSETSFNLWIKGMELVEMSDTSVFLKVQNNFIMDFISKNEIYIKLIFDCVTDALGIETQIVLVSEKSAEPDVETAVQDFIQTGKQESWLFCYPEKLSVEEPPEEQEPAREELPLKATEGPGAGRQAVYNEKYTFDNFIVGSTNRFAYSASRAVAENPSNAYNPLFIYGPSGLGKTHLLFAITNEILKISPDTNVIYVDGEDFVIQFLELMKKNQMHLFREKYRNVDVLLVDDVHILAGKPATQEEFFHTFNQLYQQNKQIILTSDRPPKEISTLEERMKSRFESGLIADIQPPDLELRIAILKKKCEEAGLVAENDVIEYIAEQIKDNIRQMEGAVKKMKAYSFITGIPIDMNLAKNIIRDITSGDEPQSVLVDRIFKVVGEAYGVTNSDILGKKRSKEIVQARHTVIYMLSKVVNLSSKNIANILEVKDHTTALYAINNIDKKAKTDPELAKTLSDMVKKIRG